MGYKVCLVFLLLALAMVAEASKLQELDRYDNGSLLVGDAIGEDNEMMLDSEENRRTLRGRRRYISYGALRAGQVPCGRRGRSYYNCNQRGRANPYRRGCTAATFCQRQLG